MESLRKLNRWINKGHKRTLYCLIPTCLAHRQNYLGCCHWTAFPSQGFHCFLFLGRKPKPDFPLALVPFLARPKSAFLSKALSTCLSPLVLRKGGKADPTGNPAPTSSSGKRTIAAWVFLKVKFDLANTEISATG